MKLVYCALAIMFKIFLPPSEALHIVHFRTITNEMKKMIQNAEYPDDDPLELQDLTKRQEICDEVLTARQYAILNSHINENTIPEGKSNLVEFNFQRRRRKSRKTHPFVQNVAYYKDHGRWVTHPLRLIQCLNLEKDKWFVGFDQDNERAYLVLRMQFVNRVVFKWIALIEKDGQHESLYSGPKMVERLFEHFVTQVKEVASKKKKNKPRMSVCDLSLIEYGRLCSAISEGLSPRLIPNERSAYNFVNASQRRCTTKEISVSDKEVISAKVVQCTLNRNRARPQFYVLNDPEVRGAAYILKHDTETLHGLRMIARMGDLKVLQDFKPKESTKKAGKKVIKFS